MEQRRTMLWGALGLLVTAVVVAGLAADTVVREPDVGERGHVRIDGIDIATGHVSGESAELRTSVWLVNRGGTAEDLNLSVRVHDADSGLLVDTTGGPVPTVEGDRDLSVTRNVTVPREGDYRLEAVLSRDGVRVDRARTRIAGLGALEPDYLSSSVGFHRFPGLPAIQYEVEAAAGNAVRLSAVAFVTNGGSGATDADDLTLVIRARQNESGIVAAEGRTAIERLGSGETAAPSVDLTVPDGYNYYLDAYLWRGDVLVATEQGTATLDPTRTIRPNRTRESVDLDVEDFERRSSIDRQATNDTAGAEEEGQAGFVAVVAAAALIGTLTALRWRER